MTSQALPAVPAIIRCIICGQPVTFAHCAMTDPERRYAVPLHPECVKQPAPAITKSAGAVGRWVSGSAIPNPNLFPGAPR